MDDKINAEFQETYRAYLRVMKKAWEAVDIDAIDIAAMSSMAPAGLQVAANTWGTAGTVGTAGTAGGSIGTFGCAFTYGTWSEALGTAGGLSARTCFAPDPRLTRYPGLAYPAANCAVAGTFGTMGTMGTVGTGTGTLGTAGCVGTAGSFG